MPWRPESGTVPNAYHALISEAMLQQTQVATVIPYFERFLERWPTVADLAAADEQEVLHAWQGLGYYRRARNLHAAAQRVVEAFSGAVPNRLDDLLSLPGVGRYTAGAIASIGFDKPEAIVDGNVSRVYSRLFNITSPIDAPGQVKQVWSIAQALVPKPRGVKATAASRSGPGCFNQAVMELGALICTPKGPACTKCPLRRRCKAHLSGKPEDLPVMLPKKKPKPVTHIIVAAKRHSKFLFEQRPASGLWSNMWQMPTWESPPLALARATSKAISKKHGQSIAQWLASHLGLSASRCCFLYEFKHQTTHRTIRFVIVSAEIDSGRLKRGSGSWHSLDQLADLPLPNPQHLAVAHLQARGSKP